MGNAFQESLAQAIKEIHNAGYTLNAPSLYDLNFAPADQAGKLLRQAKEFLSSDEYEHMLDELSINPLDAAFLVDRLNRHTVFAVSRDLVRRFHEELIEVIHSFDGAIKNAENKEVAWKLVGKMVEAQMEIATRMDKELPVIAPPPKQTREEMTIALLALGIDEINIEQELDRAMQEQETYYQEIAKQANGHFYRDQMGETIKRILSHPEDFLESEEDEDEE